MKTLSNDANNNIKPTLGRSIPANLKITGKMTDRAAKAGTTILGGKK